MKLMKRNRELVRLSRNIKTTRRIPKESIRDILHKNIQRRYLDSFFSNSFYAGLLSLEMAVIGMVAILDIDKLGTTCGYIAAVGASIGLVDFYSNFTRSRAKDYEWTIGEVAHNQRRIIDKNDIDMINHQGCTLEDL